MEKNKIKIIIPFFNPGDYFDMCINSVLTQDYENYEVLFIDDSSTDNSYDKIPACTYQLDENQNPIKNDEGELIITEVHPILEITKCQKVNAWKSSRRLTALPNIHNAIMNFSTDPDDVIFILYGDDWLVNKHVLKKINEKYIENDCLLTYGSAKFSDGKKCYTNEYTEKDLKIIRRITPKFSHPITFKKSLYTKLIETDPKFECFTDNSNEWFTCCSNHALFFPLAELAGLDQIKIISDILYIYNTDNPLNSERLNSDLYFETLELIQNKKSLIK